MSADQRDTTVLDRLTAAALALSEDERKRLVLRLGESIVNDPAADPARRERVLRTMERVRAELNPEPLPAPTEG